MATAKEKLNDKNKKKPSMPKKAGRGRLAQSMGKKKSATDCK